MTELVVWKNVSVCVYYTKPDFFVFLPINQSKRCTTLHYNSHKSVLHCINFVGQDNIPYPPWIGRSGTDEQPQSDDFSAPHRGGNPRN